MSADSASNDGAPLAFISLGVAIFMSLLMVGVVVARFMVKRAMRTSVRVPDYLVIVSLIMSLVNCGLDVGIMFAVNNGIPDPALEPDTYTLVLKLVFIMNFVSLVLLYSLTKVALLLNLYRIFDYKYFTTLVYLIGTIVVVSSISYFFVIIFQCSPVRKAWDFALEGKCINQIAFYRWSQIPDITTNFLLAVIPLPSILLSRPRPLKLISHLVIFVIGLLLFVVSVLREYYYFQGSLAHRGRVTTFRLGLISMIEGALLVIVTSFPVIWLYAMRTFASRTSSDIESLRGKSVTGTAPTRFSCEDTVVGDTKKFPLLTNPWTRSNRKSVGSQRTILSKSSHKKKCHKKCHPTSYTGRCNAESSEFTNPDFVVTGTTQWTVSSNIDDPPLVPETLTKSQSHLPTSKPKSRRTESANSLSGIAVTKEVTMTSECGLNIFNPRPIFDGSWNMDWNRKLSNAGPMPDGISEDIRWEDPGALFCIEDMERRASRAMLWNTRRMSDATVDSVASVVKKEPDLEAIEDRSDTQSTKSSRSAA